MPRPLRIEYPGAVYHVMNRGDRRQDIFRDVHDRQRFLGTLSETCGKNRMADSRLLPYAQPFSFGDRDAAAKPGRWDEMALVDECRRGTVRGRFLTRSRKEKHLSLVPPKFLLRSPARYCK